MNLADAAEYSKYLSIFYGVLMVCIIIALFVIVLKLKKRREITQNPENPEVDDKTLIENNEEDVSPRNISMAEIEKDTKNGHLSNGNGTENLYNTIGNTAEKNHKNTGKYVNVTINVPDNSKNNTSEPTYQNQDEKNMNENQVPDNLERQDSSDLDVEEEKVKTDIADEKAKMYATTSIFPEDEATKIANKMEDSGLYNKIIDDVKPTVMQVTMTPLVDIEDKTYKDKEQNEQFELLKKNLEGELTQVVKRDIDEGKEEVYGNVDHQRLDVFSKNTTLKLRDINAIIKELKNFPEFKDIAMDIKWITLRLQNKSVNELKKEVVYKEENKQKVYICLLDTIAEHYSKSLSTRFSRFSFVDGVPDQ